MDIPDPFSPLHTYQHAMGYGSCRTHSLERVREHIPVTTPCMPLGPHLPQATAPAPTLSSLMHPQHLPGKNQTNTVEYNKDLARVRVPRHYCNTNIITQNKQQTKILILENFLLFNSNRVIPFKRVIYKEIKKFTYSSSSQVQ